MHVCVSRVHIWCLLSKSRSRKMNITFLYWEFFFLLQKVSLKMSQAFTCPPFSFSRSYSKSTVSDLPLKSHPESTVQLWANISKQLWHSMHSLFWWHATLVVAPYPAPVFGLRRRSDCIGSQKAILRDGGLRRRLQKEVYTLLCSHLPARLTFNRIIRNKLSI